MNFKSFAVYLIAHLCLLQSVVFGILVLLILFMTKGTYVLEFSLRQIMLRIFSTGMVCVSFRNELKLIWPLSTAHPTHQTLFLVC